MLRYRLVATALLVFVPLGVTFGDNQAHGTAEVERSTSGNATSNDATQGDLYILPNYAGLSEHTSMILAHIIFMTMAWFLVLPIGMVILSITLGT
jgi:hypothetical protein